MDSKKEKAFLELYERSADALFRHCYFKTSDSDIAKDIAQDAFMKTWQYLADGHTVENPKAFVFRTAHNLIIDHYRKKKESSLDVLQENGFDPSDDAYTRIAEHADGVQALALVGKLEAPYADAIVMRYVNGLSVTEIAEMTGESVDVISVRIHRALKKLKELLTHGNTN